MEFNQRSTMENQSEYRENCVCMTDLDDHLMDFILKHLPPNDLASMSRTCKKYKELAERTFYLNQLSTPIDPIMITTRKEDVKFFPKRSEEYAYEKWFSSKIRSVHLSAFGVAEMNRGYAFIREKCAKDILSLTLEFIYFFKDMLNADIIKDQLINVKSVKLVNILFDALLQHCKNIESLEVSCKENSKDDIGQLKINSEKSWMNQTFPKLKHLILCVPRKLQFDIKGFLARHTAVDSIICTDYNAIKSLCQSENQFQYVALVFCENRSYSDIVDLIVDWNKRQKSKILEISMQIYGLKKDMFRKMIGLQNLVAIHFCILQYTMGFFSESQLVFPNVTKLCMPIGESHLENKIADVLDTVFPNVQELNLRVCGASIDFENTFENQMMPIVSRFKNLKKLTFEHLDVMKSNFNDIIKLNNVRSKLLASTQNINDKLVIHLDYTERSHSFDIPENSLIGVQPSWDVELYCKLCFRHL